MVQTIILMMSPQQGGSNPMSMLIMFGGIFLVMYFFMIRPQQAKQKEQKKYQDGLAKGDKVITGSGIHGKVAKVNNEQNTIEIEIAQNVIITVEKSAISQELSIALDKKK